MKTLSIDIETYSSANLAKCGVYRYAEALDFEILLFGYSVDSGSVQVVDLACGEKIPPEVIDGLTDETVTKWAFNANFERVCLSRFLGLPTGEYLDPVSWRCSMIYLHYKPQINRYIILHRNRIKPLLYKCFRVINVVPKKGKTV